MKVSPVCFLRRSQQLEIAAGITPCFNPEQAQWPVHSLKPEYFVLASAVVASHAPGQQTVYYLKLGADQPDAKSIRKRLENQRWGRGAESNYCSRLYFGGDRF